MKKLFTLFILFLLLPVTALAAAPNGQVIYVGNFAVTSSGYWTTDNDGIVTAVTDGSTPTDSYIHYDAENNILTLHNATIKVSVSLDTSSYLAGAAIGVLNEIGNAELTIKLEGTNTIANVDSGINMLAASASTTSSSSLTITGNGSLTTEGSGSGSYSGILVQSNAGNANLTINNVDVTATNSNTQGIRLQPSASASATLTVNGGSLTASGSKGIDYQFGSGTTGSGTPTVTVSGNAIVRANGGIGDNSTADITIGADSSSNNGGIVWNGTDGTVYGNVTLQGNITIGEGESLTIPDGSSLNMGGHEITVESGGKLEGEPGGDGTVVSAPKITTESLPDGTVNQPYSATLEATGNNITWSLANETTLPDGLTLNSDGTITGTPTTAGSSTFTVKAENSVGSDSKELMLTVTAPTTYTITAEASPTESGTVMVNGGTSPVSVEANSTVNLVATPNAGYRFTGWTSSNEGVSFADASSASTTFTMPAGDVTVIAQFEQYNPVTNITLNETGLILYTGDSETLTATIEPDNATNQTVTWESSDPNVATVDNGEVTAVGVGEATITATAGGKMATCEVKVRKPADVGSTSSTNLSLTTDRDEFALTATIRVNGELQNPNDSWTWSVVNEDVVALSGSPTWRSQSYSISHQTFTVRGTGTTSITATYDDGIYWGSVVFTVHISKPTPPDPISYYNIYVEDVCDGVDITTSKNVVREGGTISLYIEKDTANYTFDNFKVYYKRSYYGPWEVLEEGVQPGEYPIRNIWTHIYVKAEGAEEKEDPTGIEQVEGVKVYTKDGSLYVQTPQREQVLVITMTGVVVKNEEQVGLKQYHGLQPGIYVVRAGNAVYKVRLH